MSALSHKPTIIPMKVGLFGEQGTGKTTSAALLAAALSKQFHSGAPVYVVDPELGWQFPKRRIFTPEGVELRQNTTATFKGMIASLREAESAGACVWVVELSKIWMDLLKTVQAKCGDRWGSELVKLWGEYVTCFLNSPLHCFALGRVGDITDDIENERGEIKRVKVGEGMKAGGQKNNFGYEPHLVLRLSLERKPRRKAGKVLEDEGRMIHRCDVLKDRTWELNGKVFRWPDKDGYQPGGFRQVWESLHGHFRELQATQEQVLINTEDSSAELLDEDGQSNYYKDKRTRESYLADFKAVFAALFGGQTADAKNLALTVRRALTGTISETRMENELTTRQLEQATLALLALEERIKLMGKDTPRDTMGMINLVDCAKQDVAESKKAFDETRGVEQFYRKPVVTDNFLEKQLERSIEQANAKREQAAGD
jgi:hypothetical protein